jgi:Rrf2 family iron-sulfur cluster assembly transcriptional regulator
MRFSLQVQYAICGVFDIAYNGQGGPVRVRSIGERQEIPVRYLEQIFQRLRRSDLVRAKRGPGGGYTLARSPAEISIRAIVEAVEGPIDSAAPREGAPGAGATSAHRPDFLWDELADRFGEVLEQTTVETLCTQAARGRIPRAGAETYSYEI